MHEQREDTIGRWVALRCCLRRDVYSEPMPEYVKKWVDGIGHGSKTDGSANAPDDVRRWLTQTIVDPDWPRPVP